MHVLKNIFVVKAIPFKKWGWGMTFCQFSRPLYTKNGIFQTSLYKKWDF
jgi:hypothetical protein